jgi:hypothetical protein
MLYRDIQDLFKLGHFDKMNQMITLTIITLSSALCVTKCSWLDVKRKTLLQQICLLFLIFLYS